MIWKQNGTHKIIQPLNIGEYSASDIYIEDYSDYVINDALIAILEDGVAYCFTQYQLEQIKEILDLESIEYLVIEKDDIIEIVRV